MVCGGQTGHAEAIQIEFDPKIVAYEELLDIFWANHAPTTLNRQGADIGSQYRSAIFYHSEAQQKTAATSRLRLAQSGRYSGEIVTQITPADIFNPAEDYHQQYLKKKGLV